MTKERLFPERKICYRYFGGDGAGPSKCGHGVESGGCVLGECLTDAGGGDAEEY
jgi:hypothetical protein